jgi:hypothetical protein
MQPCRVTGSKWVASDAALCWKFRGPACLQFIQLCDSISKSPGSRLAGDAAADQSIASC